MISRPISILLVLVSITVGYILMYWGYGTSLPSYIGEWVCLAGMILVISAGIYALIIMVKKMKKVFAMPIILNYKSFGSPLEGNYIRVGTK